MMAMKGRANGSLRPVCPYPLNGVLVFQQASAAASMNSVVSSNSWLV